MVAATAMPTASNVMSVSAPLATDFSARNSVIRTMIPKKPPAANVIHIGKVGKRQSWSSDKAQAQFMREVPHAAFEVNACTWHPSQGCFCELGRLAAGHPPHPAIRGYLQETASWLSLATRSKASVELLIRYWQSSPSVGSRRMISYAPLAAGRATLLAVNKTCVPTGNLCFNTLSITQTAPASHMVPLRRPAESPAVI